MPHFRIGHGYDVHRLVPGRKLVLGGVEIPHDMGLDGHSDADVLAHAIMDALLGAAALGDIGQHFPPSDDTYKDADSLVLLHEVCKKISKAGYAISNIDSTIVAQAPKLAPHIAAMQMNLIRTCKLRINQVNVKATTEEGLGFTGAQQGIAAHAVVLLTN
ncbi:MAG: 2-C-methyl-D-erythritol 2,4-cyclodiphosphate synthase [Oscillospiraceae bacterium]|nr:2-C-methyl-D-erythritol 2,4-cyclodiphosphate synthase [Oscillospiraceae bacterium]